MEGGYIGEGKMRGVGKEGKSMGEWRGEG